jgi:uncharacterized protein (TIGR02284 family)
MAEMTKNSEQIAKHLNSLIELDYDAVEAYEAAIARLTDGTERAKLRAFMADHHRHIVDLSPLVIEFGGTPAKQGDFKRVLTKGKVVVAGLAGTRAVLEAMKSNEETTTKTYRKASTEPGLPSYVRAVLDRNFADEQRHLAWIEERLNATEQRERTVESPRR